MIKIFNLLIFKFSINPAIIADDFIAKSLGLDPKVMNPELEKAGKSYPLGRLGTTEDMANLILFLSSKDSAFLTGQNICADGGSTWGGDSQVRHAHFLHPFPINFF